MEQSPCLVRAFCVSLRVFHFCCSQISEIMARWTAEDFIQELSSIQKLASLRPGTDVETKLVVQLQDRMKHHPGWTADQLCKMIEAVTQSSLSGSNKDSLLKALDEAACPTVSAQSQVKLTSKPQTLVQIFNYLSKEDWAKLECSSSWDSTVVMAERLRRCGLTSLKEETKKWATAIIVQLQIKRANIAPTYDQVYYLAEQLHKVFLNTSVTKKASGCTVYPLHPGEMGQAFLEQAYEEGDPPEARDLPGLAARVAHETPVRSTSSLLSWNQDKSNKQKAKDGSDPGLCSLMHRFLQQTVGHLDQNTLQALQLSKNASLSALQQQPCPVPAPSSNLQLVLPTSNVQGTSMVPAPATLPQLSQSPSLQALQHVASPQHGTHPDSTRVPAQQCTRESMLQIPATSPEVPAPKVVEVEPPPAEAEVPVDPAASTSKLQQIEQEAFEGLLGAQKKKGAMKRPAAAVSAAPKAAKVDPSATKTPKLKLGCIRCRGCVNGCSSCQEPDFKGMRLNREEWKAWFADRQLQLAAAKMKPKGKANSSNKKAKK